jgi:arginyl-tRNA synthetase
VTPAELSESLRAALAGAVADGTFALDAADLPSTVHVERPRQKGHGDYATNVALQLAKKAGMNPRAFAGLARRRARGPEASSKVEIAGPGFLNITVDAAAQGALAAPDRRRRRRVRPHRDARRRVGSTSSSSPRTRPARSTSAACAGPPSATASPVCSRRRRRVTASTTSTTTARRSTGSPRRCSPRAGRAGAGGRLRRQYIDDIAEAVSRRPVPGDLRPRTLPDAEAQEAFRARRAST